MDDSNRPPLPSGLQQAKLMGSPGKRLEETELKTRVFIPLSFSLWSHLHWLDLLTKGDLSSHGKLLSINLLPSSGSEGW